MRLIRSSSYPECYDGFGEPARKKFLRGGQLQSIAARHDLGDGLGLRKIHFAVEICTCGKFARPGRTCAEGKAIAA